jgi:hypothetical protein
MPDFCTLCESTVVGAVAMVKFCHPVTEQALTSVCRMVSVTIEFCGDVVPDI